MSSQACKYLNDHYNLRRCSHFCEGRCWQEILASGEGKTEPMYYYWLGTFWLQSLFWACMLFLCLDCEFM